MSEEQAIAILRYSKQLAIKLMNSRDLPQLTKEELSLLRQVWEVWQLGYADDTDKLKQTTLDDSELAILIGTYSTYRKWNENVSLKPRGR